MALKIIDWGSDDYNQVLQLRDEVLRKPLGLHFSDEELQKEKEHMHMGAYEDGRMLGCCM